jgi:hypothetical protein
VPHKNKLFDKLSFFLGRCRDVNSGQLIKLLRLAGGTVVTKVAEADVIVGSADWLKAAVGEYPYEA